MRRSHGLAANPFRLFPRVIVSMAWLPDACVRSGCCATSTPSVGRRNSARRFAFDVLVVDEAHHVAPASPSAVGGGRGYAVDSQRTIATRALAERCEHRLFLSATPHNGYSESFTALLEMIDDRRFSRGATLDERRCEEVTVRRLKTELTDKDFQPREIKTIPFTPTERRAGAFAELDRILDRAAPRPTARERSRRHRRDAAEEAVPLEPVGVRPHPGAVRRRRGQRHAPTSTRTTSTTRRCWAASSPTRRRAAPSSRSSRRCARARAPIRWSPPRRSEIDRLVAWGRGYEHRPDSRLEALIGFLDAVCRPDGRTWTNERVVVFTEYAATLDWIVGVLEQRGYGARARHHPGLDADRGARGRSGPGSRADPADRSRCGCWWPPTPPVRASTCRPTATGW